MAASVCARAADEINIYVCVVWRYGLLVFTLCFVRVT